MNPNSKEFKQLQKEWYQKLKDSGFEDHETKDNLYLKEWSQRIFKANSEDAPGDRSSFYEAKQEYYRFAGHFLHDYAFINEVEKNIWDLHSQGVSIRNIVERLKSENIKTYRFKIHKILSRLSKIMKEMYKVTSNDKI